MPPEFQIDTRPLWRILLARSLQPAMVLAGAAIYVALQRMERPEGLSPEGQKALAVFGLCVFYWVFDVLPLMITSLLAIILIPLSGVMTAKESYALFGNEAVFFILGAFILAACMMKSGLSKRLALAILYRFGRTPRTLLASILLLNAGMAFLMSEHAVAAMNFPIILEIASVLHLSPRRSRYGKALFLAMAWGSTIGGIATLLGGGRAALALGILKDATGKTLTFVEWSLSIAPLVIVLLPVCYVILLVFFPIDIASVKEADDVLRSRSAALGRVRYKEFAIGAMMLMTFAAWVVLGEEFGLANVALASVVLLFVLRLVTWREIEGYVNWGVILMYGGAICLGAAINKSGAAAWVAHITIASWATDGTAVILMLSLLSLLLTEAMSNSAVVALLLPVSLGIAQEFGIDPRAMALVIAIPAGLATTLPIGTPANAIAYSSGHLSMRDMAVPGALLGFVSWVMFNLLAKWYWPFLGLTVQ